MFVSSFYNIHSLHGSVHGRGEEEINTPVIPISLYPL